MSQLVSNYTILNASNVSIIFRHCSHIFLEKISCNIFVLVQHWTVVVNLQKYILGKGVDFRKSSWYWSHIKIKIFSLHLKQLVMLRRTLLWPLFPRKLHAWQAPPATSASQLSKYREESVSLLL